MFHRAIGRTTILVGVLAMPSLARAQGEAPPDLRNEVRELQSLVRQLQARIETLEARSGVASQPLAAPAPTVESAPPATNVGAANAALPSVSGPANPLPGSTINVLLDGYYGYNFNSPAGRANLLRAYDVSSNSFSLNQAALVLENAPDPANGKRWGARVDLQWGQATQTLQGNANNEPRPGIYQSVFQAYGTYVFPVGNGLTVDFGKWASSLGMEGNYTKDQINYSRAYLFDFLPFYHMGVRASYTVSSALALNYWVVNGTEQTEAFNNFKDQYIGFVAQPAKTVSWTAGYYLGQENPDTVYYPNGGAPPNAPTIQGVPFEPIPNPPKAHLNIFDSYLSWQASPLLLLAFEGDYVTDRQEPGMTPQHVAAAAGYTRYQLTPKFALAARAEYLSDRGGLYSGVTQALKETTFTTEYKVATGFMLRAEWRRDFSNHPYFYTSILGDLKKEQNTATLGLVWWWGAKQGNW